MDAALATPLVNGFIVVAVGFYSGTVNAMVGGTLYDAFGGSWPLSLIVTRNNGSPNGDVACLLGGVCGSLPAGNYEVQVDWGNGNGIDYWCSGFLFYSGVDQVSPVSGAHSAVGAGPAATDSIVSDASSLVISAVETDSGAGATVFTAGAGGVIRGQIYQSDVALAVQEFPGASLVTTDISDDVGGITNIVGFSLKGA